MTGVLLSHFSLWVDLTLCTHLQAFFCSFVIDIFAFYSFVAAFEVAR